MDLAVQKQFHFILNERIVFMQQENEVCYQSQLKNSRNSNPFYEATNLRFFWHRLKHTKGQKRLVCFVI